MHNPLKRPILEILKTAHSPLKEYELHKILGGDAFEQFVENCDDTLILFRKHFLVMNALYELHEELLTQGFYLQISALEIQLIKINDSTSKNQALSEDSGFEKLSRYYRNWDHFRNTNDNDVTELLQTFWKKFLAHEEKNQSLKTLQLQNEASWSDIKQQYRRLCQQHHPDKGGDAIYFIEINQAYNNLKCLYERTNLDME